jgi:ABC-type methionine transport system permease subunit
VSGKVFAANYAGDTPAALNTATNDVLTAYNDAAGRTATAANVGGGELGGLTFLPGVYSYSTGVTISQDVILNGACGDVFIFQIR